ncbi:unnamed protein product [Rotaria sp. Silwood2]|nr:unnamed protein product [Rotaria sp. Silwood2]CAF4294471.1 unnamed protein product [Rotaria sp. Silwood2]
MCSNCGFITHLHSSLQIQNTRRREINIRLEIGDILCNLSRGGTRKFLGALNLPPPVQEQRYGEAQEFILHHVTKAQEESMTAAVEEVIVEVGDARELTVSEDGAWLTQGYSSVHEIAALCSTISHPKSDNESFHTVSEENFDDISHNLTVIEQMESDQDEYDDNNDYEPGGDN